MGSVVTIPCFLGNFEDKKAGKTMMLMVMYLDATGVYLKTSPQALPILR